MDPQLKHRKSMQSVPTFADDHDFSESYVWTLIRNKRLRAVKVGRSTRITAEDAAAFRAGLTAIGEAA